MPNDFAPGPTAAVCAPLFAGAALLDAEKYRCALNPCAAVQRCV